MVSDGTVVQSLMISLRNQSFCSDCSSRTTFERHIGRCSTTSSMSYSYRSAHPIHHTFSANRGNLFWRPISSHLLLGAALFVSWFFCIWIGYHLRGPNVNESGLKAIAFQYNRTFSMRPSVESDQAWKDLFPGEFDGQSATALLIVAG